MNVLKNKLKHTELDDIFKIVHRQILFIEAAPWIIGYNMKPNYFSW